MKLYRFASLTPKIKTTLVKTQLLPIIEYPLVLLVCASKTQQLKLQRALNKLLRFMFRHNRQLTLEQMHELTNIKSITVKPLEKQYHLQMRKPTTPSEPILHRPTTGSLHHKVLYSQTHRLQTRFTPRDSTLYHLHILTVHVSMLQYIHHTTRHALHTLHTGHFCLTPLSLSSAP